MTRRFAGLGLALVLLASGCAGEAQSLQAWLDSFASAEAGHGALVLGVALAAATLVSEDLACLAAGGLVAQGALAYPAAALACFLGIFSGDVLLFLGGRWLGPRVLARAPCRWFLEPRAVEEAARWLERRGAIVILGSRFLPGARLPTYFASGALGTEPLRFAAWFALAGLLWTPLLVGLAAGVGGGLARFEWVRGGGAWLLVGTLLAAWLLVALARSLATWRGRALFLARLRRCTRFEYWPLGVFYLPVFALVLLRALRGQGLVFTAANPALPHGGFVGESKRAIYGLLAAAGAPLPRMRVVAPGERAGAGRRLLDDILGGGFELPLVVKPDAGQRGDGVRVVRSRDELAAALASSGETMIVQAYVPGEEYGVFTVQPEPLGAGRILSIAHKVLPALEGDGVRTLERLILAHREHRPLARVFLARPRAELERVPAAGERVTLGELGTHCRGARFFDASELATPALARSLERIVRALPGFHFGRFDVRADSAEALRAGRFTVLELNGVTSEAAHVYDPRCGLFCAWCALVAQWRLAYTIGAANARRGARVSTVGELWAAVRAYRALDASRNERARAAVPMAEPAGVEARA